MQDKPTSSPLKGARLSVHARPERTAGHLEKTASGLGMVPAYLQLKRILVPVDFSVSSEKALRYAARFGEQFGSDIVLLHVIQPLVFPVELGYPAPMQGGLEEPAREHVEARLKELAGTLTPAPKALLRVGQPYNEITLAAKELDVDLIIIATHGHTGLKHALLGSTAERVVRHAPCPVLTLREGERDFV